MSATNEEPSGIPVEQFGVSSRRRGSRLGDKALRIQRTKHPRQVQFSFHPDTIRAARFRDREKLSLVMNSDRVDQVGLRHVDCGYYPQFRADAPNRGSWTMTFRQCGLADAFVPLDGGFYEPTVDVQEETGTLWFPLPYGRSLHTLRPYFDYAWRDLDHWIFDSCCQQLADELRFFREPGDSGSLRLEIKRRDDGEILGPLSLDIPDALLQDPIRNGSACKEHGFNPWNEDQKALIKAHLFAIVQPLLNPDKTQPTAEDIAFSTTPDSSVVPGDDSNVAAESQVTPTP